jgi:hypothetical protein
MARDTCVVFGRGGGSGRFPFFFFSERPAPAKKNIFARFLAEKYSARGCRFKLRPWHQTPSRWANQPKPPTRKKASAQQAYSISAKCATSNTAPARFLPRFLRPSPFSPSSSSAKPTAPQRLANPAPCKNKGGVKKGRSWVHFRLSAIVYQPRLDTGLPGAARRRSGKISIRSQPRICTAAHFRPASPRCWSVGGTSNNTSNNHKPFSLNNLTLLF